MLMTASEAIIRIMTEARFLRESAIRICLPCSLTKSLFFAVLLSFIATIVKGDGRNWIKGFIGTPRDQNTPLVRCEIITVSSTAGHLVGDLIFVNETDAKVEIEGERKKDETFWPSYTAQVIGEGEKEWRTIGESAKAQNIVKQSITGFSEHDVYVNMDVFRPAIGKGAYGRIVFSNGVWTMFDLGLFVE